MLKYLIKPKSIHQYTQIRRSNVLACKEGLLFAARASLLAAPFIWHFKLHLKYRKATGWFIKTPIMLACLTIAFGLDQCPDTGRWRLLWMTDHEEHEWSNKRLKSLLDEPDIVILDHKDERTKLILTITRRLINSLPHTNRRSILPTWPDPITHGISSLVDRRELKRPSTCTSNVTLANFPEGLTVIHPSLKSAWNIYVIDGPQINAYAMPSKELVVYSGLIDLLDGKPEYLATVLAHEIAHVTQRHAVENLGLKNVATVVADFVRGAIISATIPFPILTSSLTLTINWINDPLSESAFSRKLELEADAVGLKIMAKAGYDPSYALHLWAMMSTFDKDNEDQKTLFEQLFPFLNTHPPSQMRLKNIREHMGEAISIYNNTLDDKIIK
ncbi:hypothetical protein E3Q22_03660 [Wallemia mellicola]|uniref:Peptidase M48 domain-containing protein n=1 Tax=Wallemia mellicola TaxID=1708541 RepID=A0A4T0PFQ9_9BASI|nr:hypothetical protein E3Q22_03660 [Wallemia mellicola]TIB95512.1 hypothetical protein E3Q18_03684 [Wallemia mellicola]TIC02068.1 hypothetical protein E3Q16_03602 [Wallemia mellicola]TIC08970.1 hypothetical protein E3Q14_03643 [Wallemia mellicola]TIC09456.1 hypothetical protein E3Q15_03509 [Wallemia mellicola]